MAPLELSLAVAALVIGLTGAWSPCGFSMVETIGPGGHTGGRGVTIAACAAFLPGALAGGVLTFGTLAALGDLLHGAGELAYLAAAAVAASAALAELLGKRIVPQIRRQLPEHWRRVMPMPLAAFLYGVLLGLGFTTFVLTFGVWALAGISLALGDLLTGALIGAAFGAGRALPVAVLAPLADRPSGGAAIEAMAERPAIYRGFRFGDGLALAAVAAVLGSTGTALGTSTAVDHGADPSRAGRDLAFQREDDRGALLQRGGGTLALPGTDPALGGRYAAVIAGGEAIRILERKTLDPLETLPAPDADAVAISDRWLVWRARESGVDTLWVRRLGEPLNPGARRKLDRKRPPGQLGRPGLDDHRVAWAEAGRERNRIRIENLRSERRRAVFSARHAALSNPTLRGDELLYVRETDRRERLMLKRLPRRGKGRSLLSRRRGTLWSTELAAKAAYVTLLRGAGPAEEKIIHLAP